VYDPEVRPEYDAIVMKALAKERDYRYQSADEMRADIERALDGLPVSAAQSVAYGAGQMGGYGQPQGYGQQDQYGRTTAMPQQGSDAAGQTSLLPGVGQGYDVGGDGYDTGGGYDDGYGGRGDRRRAGNGGGGGKNRNASWIVLAVAAVLVLVGAYFVTQYFVNGHSSPSTFPVPNLVNQSLTDAQAAVKNVQGNLQVVQGSATSCDPAVATKGNVCTQTPIAGTSLPTGGTITIHLSTGAPAKAVPDVSKKTQDQAIQALQAAGFTPGTPTTQASDTVPNGQVIGTNPPAGTQAATGSSVSLILSSGPAQVKVPSVLGENANDASSDLRKAGLNYSQSPGNQYDPRYTSGTVSQLLNGTTPVNPGDMVPPNTTITIVINPANPNQGQTQGQIQGQTQGQTGTPTQGAAGIGGGNNQGQTGQPGG
jgi:serine/threonine-protein kinase